MQVLWSVLQAYAEAEGAISAALADPVAVKAAAPKKLPGTKDPVDPDEWLPVSAPLHCAALLRLLYSSWLASKQPAEDFSCAKDVTCNVAYTAS